MNNDAVAQDTGRGIRRGIRQGIWLRRLQRRAWLLPVFVIVAALLIWPAVMLGVGSFRTSPPGVPGDWSMQGVWDAIAMPGIAVATRNSIFLAVTTTIIALVAGGAFAFLSQRSDARWRRALTPVMMVVFATPPLFYAMAYSLMGNKFNGYANELIALWLGKGVLVFNIESWPGLLFVTAIRAIAFCYLFLVPAFKALDRSLEEASLVAGRGQIGTFFFVSLPLLAPAITGAAILALIAGLHSFDTILVLGEPAGIRVIATELYDLLVHAYPPAYAQGSFISLVLVLVVGGLCIFQTLLMGRRKYFTVVGKSVAPRVHKLREWQLPANILIGAFVVLGVIAPFVSLVYAAFQPFPGVHGTLTWLHFERVFSRPGTSHAVSNTLVLSIGVGALAMLLAMTLAQISAAFDTRVRGFIRFATLVPYAMPGIVAALAVTWAYVSVPGLRQIYGTIWMLVLAFTVVVMPFAMQIAQSAVAQVSTDLACAARVSGASALRAGVSIVGRLTLPSFFVGWFLVAITIGGNLDVPLLLGTPTLGTIAQQIYVLQSQAQLGDATALLVSSMASATVIGALAWLAARLAAWARSRNGSKAPLSRRKPAVPASGAFNQIQTLRETVA